MGYFNAKLHRLRLKLIKRVEEYVRGIGSYFKPIPNFHAIENESKIVVFAGDVLPARIARLSFYLRKRGFYSILLTKKSDTLEAFAKESFDLQFQFESSRQLKKVLRILEYKAKVFHAFGAPCNTAKLVIELTTHNLYDFQDLLVTNFGMNPPFNYMREGIIFEKFCLENSSKLVCHSLELQVAKRFYNLPKDSKKNFYFPNYLDSYLFQNRSPSSDEIHIVYVGTVHSLHREKRYFGGAQIHWLIDTLNEQKVHLHVYPSPEQSKEQLIDYYKLDNDLLYFHLHNPVAQRRITAEISKYNFGIIPFYNHSNERLDAKRKYATSLKLYNFIEAGLPVIVSDDLDFQFHIAQKMGAAIRAKYEELFNIKFLLKDKQAKSLRNKLMINRKNYDLESKIDLLINQYESINPTL